MKKFIREMLDDLRKKNPPEAPPIINLTPPPTPTTPGDLENQILSKNHEEQVRQLDFQAQQQEIIETEES